MTQTMPSEFPFVQQLPHREKSKLVKLWDHFAAVRMAMDQHGMLVPVKLAAELAGVSRQRIDELVERDQLVRIDLAGHPFITENSFVQWAKSERKNGRPLKQHSAADTWKIAKKVVASKTASKNS